MKTTKFLGMLIAFFVLTALAGCSKEEDDFEEQPTENSIVIKGVATTSNGKPLANVIVKLDYEERSLWYCEVRHKAETKTDNNGAYRLSFQLKDDELLNETDEGSFRTFILSFDLTELSKDKYIMPEDFEWVPEFKGIYEFEASDRGKTYEENIYIPEKRMMSITIDSDIPVRQNDEYFVVNSINYGDHERKSGLRFPIDLYAGERTVQIPCALNDSNRISLYCVKEGVGQSELVSAEQKMIVTSDEPQSVVLSNEWFPDECKFKLSVQTDNKLPSSFDLFTFKVLDNEGRYSPFPKFTEYYDSIIWSAEAYPDNERIYYKEKTATSSGEKTVTQWASYFYQKEPLWTYLKGYKNGRVVHTDSLKLQFYPKDFLFINWKGTDIHLTDTAIGIYCRLYKDVEFSVLPPHDKDGHIYAKVSLYPKQGEEDASLAIRAKEVLIGLMDYHLGASKAFDEASIRERFHCLPSDVTPVTFWQTESTYAVLVLTSSDEFPQTYYIHAEPKG